MIVGKHTALIIALICCLLSCKKVLKDWDDYFPEIELTSAAVLSDGSVELVGTVISEGASPIEFAGFCVSTQPMPVMDDDQAIVSVDGNTFTVIYDGFDPYTRYYFRAWAVNEWGYTYSNILSLDSIVAQPVDPPCAPSMNTIDFIVGVGGGNEVFDNVDEPMHGFKTWDFRAWTTGSGIIDFSFGSAPHTGVYTSTSGPPEDIPNGVYLYVQYGAGGGAALSDQPVYVKEITPSLWEVTLCDVTWKWGSSDTFKLSGALECPYP